MALFALAGYARFSPRWPSSLDAFTMTRLGAAMAEKVPLMVGVGVDGITVLDEMPGWIGNVSDDHEEVGRLGLGTRRPVDRRRRYECYDADNEILHRMK